MTNKACSNRIDFHKVTCAIKFMKLKKFVFFLISIKIRRQISTQNKYYVESCYASDTLSSINIGFYVNIVIPDFVKSAINRN